MTLAGDARFRPLLERWADLWGVPDLPSRVTIHPSARLRRSLGRCQPATGRISIRASLLDGNPRLREEVLCHEAAHVAVHALRGRAPRPHGPEWRELVRAAGFEPRVRRAGDGGDAGNAGVVSNAGGAGNAGDARDAGDGPPSAPRRASGRFAYEHRCPVCQAVRYANTAHPRWQCLECGEAGLEGGAGDPAGGAVVMSGPCPFCQPYPAWVFHEGDGVVALWDAFPASPGHALVVPRRHVAGWFDATREEQRELLEAVDVARARIEASHAPDGYNIGVNVARRRGRRFSTSTCT